MKTLLKLVGILFCAGYLLNPFAGIFEFIPDNIPFLGNLDEAFFTALLLYLLRSFRKVKPPAVRT